MPRMVGLTQIVRKPLDRTDGQNLGKDKLPRMVGPLLSPLPMGMRLLVGPYTPTMEMTPPFRTDLPQPDGPA